MARFEERDGRVEDVDAEDVVGAIRLAAGPLPQLGLAYERRTRLLWLTLRPEPKPVLTVQLLESVVRVQRAVMMLWGGEARHDGCPVRYLAYRAGGAVFSLGADLDFELDCLAMGDRAALEAYARLAVEAACRNADGLNGLVVTLAAVGGHASGGGVDLARSCQVVAAEAGASFGYPELRLNRPPIASAGILARRLGPGRAERLLTAHGPVSAADLRDLGGLEAVVPDGASEDWLRGHAARTLPSHAARASLAAALHRGSNALADDLADAAGRWVEGLLALGPRDLTRMRRAARAQERGLARLYGLDRV